MKFGTHNLHDYTGTPTAFADIIVFTEAIPSRVRAFLEPKGYKVEVCRQQKDLIIAYRKDKVKRTGRKRYKRIHGGVAGVTPHRGTFWFTVKFISGPHKRRKATVIAEHRINAAFPPFKRGEPKFRAEKWNDHTNFTVSLIRRLKRKNDRLWTPERWLTVPRIILAGGDLNTIRGVLGYAGELIERGKTLDRVGTHGVGSGPGVLMSRKGSDHPRLYVRF